jgi:hypothetical protein
MKKLFFSIFMFFLLSSSISIGQQIGLEDAPVWYLENAIIDGQDNPITINNEITEITAKWCFSEGLLNIARESGYWQFETSVCGWLDGSYSIINSEQFELSNLEEWPETCSLNVNTDFELLYFNFYEEEIIYSFYIEAVNDDMVLTISRPNGNQAIYRAPILGINDIETFSFTVYPNPVNDVLYIDSTIEIKAITVYDILGRVLLFQENNSNSIDVSSLKSNLLLVEINTDIGTLMKKIIKE